MSTGTIDIYRIVDWHEEQAKHAQHRNDGVTEEFHTSAASLIRRLQAQSAPTRGDLSVAYNSACARRVEAEEAFSRARAAAARSTAGRQAEVYYDADQRLRAAREDEAAKRAALDAFEREHGLDLTHPSLSPLPPPEDE